MNLILLLEEDFLHSDRVCLSGRRYDHIVNIHRAVVGDELRVGLLNGLIGHGKILSLNPHQLEMGIVLDRQAAEPLPVTLLLALPRPKMLRRILQSITSMGVKEIYLINSYRVDKSFWNSPLLQPEKLQEQLILGLEQSCDTILPQVYLRPRFKPFVEDELPDISSGTTAYVAHPGTGMDCPRTFQSPASLAIGPEGGFIPYEVEKLQSCGFIPVNLGERILRVETAVPVLLSRFI
jgi:RsmE family RNA methyltransferase